MKPFLSPAPMKQCLRSILLVLASTSGLAAQTATDGNEGLTIRHDETLGEISVRWWSQSNVYYFLLVTSDLADDPWAYFPYATLGDDGPQGIIMSLSGDKLFFRLELTNDVNSPLLQLDQDGDKISTADELLQGTDPFLSQSLDGDTIPDDWETFHGLDTTPGVDSSADDGDPDGANNFTEYTLDLDPDYRDHPDVILNLY